METDTVIIVKKPHVINKKIYTFDTSTTQKPKIIHWGIESYYVVGSGKIKSKNNAFEFSGQSSQTAGLILSRLVENFQVGFGMELNKGSFNVSRLDTIDNSYYYKVQIKRRKEIYREIIGDSIIIIYKDFMKDTTLYQKMLLLSTVQDQVSYTYLQIPVMVGYNLNLSGNKLLLNPVLALKWASLLKSSADLIALNNNLFLVSPELNLKYNILERFSVSVKGQWTKSLTSLTDKNILKSGLNTFYYGGSFTYYF